MNLQILADKKDAIEGFNVAQVVNGECKDIFNVIDSSCESVILDGAMDHLEYDKAIELLHQSIKKVRLQGSFVVRGVCLEKMYRDYESEQTNIGAINSVIKDIKSIQSYKDVVALLSSSKFTIDTISFSNFFYEVKCSRMD
tara:strand:- start:93 stop:515 length:423 start_codon:yes stop_codon:yes gene_type:complete